MNWLQNLIVGILFFGALVILGYFTIVSESGPFAAAGNRLVVFFDNAEGIKEGSRVTVLGVPLGKVISIDLVDVDENGDPVDPVSSHRVGQRVALTAELRDEVIFYNNYFIALKNESILSGKILAIDPGRSSGGETDLPVPRIPVFFISASELEDANMTALEYTLAMRKKREFVDLQGTSSGDPIAGLSQLLDENRADVRKTISNIAEITGKINRGKGTIGSLVNDEELHKNAESLVDDAQVVVRELRETLEDTREQAPVNSFIRTALTAF
jgi:phospholipid/cholesterol/gamma-HCH transport system substrate-binding protein